MDKAWKQAQQKVKDMLDKYANTRKTAVARSFTDTYAASGVIVQAQPSDFWMLDTGSFFVIEVKSCHQDRFPFKDVRPSQWAHARRVPSSGGFSVFLIVKLPEWQWYMISGQDLCSYKDTSGMSSIPWSELRKINLKMEEVLCHIKKA